MHDRLIDDRGWGRKVRDIIPASAFRVLTRVFNFTVSKLPDGLKYSVGGGLRNSKFPYKVIKDGDFVVQVGAPRDILHAGRSRAAHFLRLVGDSGLVLVCEPDPENCRALASFVDSRGWQKRLKIFQGALWSEPGELVLLSSRNHPAANLLVTSADMEKVSEADKRERQYEEIPVEVQTLDGVFASLKITQQPRIASITTNGAEQDILNGMSEILSRRLEFIAVARTSSNVGEQLESLKYEKIAADDRGFTYKRKC